MTTQGVTDATRGKILVKGKENGDVLDMDVGEKQGGVRVLSDLSKNAPISQAQLPGKTRSNSTENWSSAPVRQPSLRESGPSVPGGSTSKHEGCGSEGEGQKRPHEPEGMPQRAPTIGEQYLHEQKGNENVPQVQQKMEGRVLPEDSKSKRQTIQAQGNGVLVGTSFEDQYRIAKAYHASGLMPKSLNSTEKVLVAMQLCRELGLPVISSLGKIMVVNQVPAIFGDLPLALVLSSGKVEDYRDDFEQKDGKPYASTFTVKRKNLSPVIRRFTLDDAKNAGLFRNDIWSKYPQRMLQCRARAWALKDAFPDVLSGVFIAEYDFNTVVEQASESTPSTRAMDRLNSLAEPDPIVLPKEEIEMSSEPEFDPSFDIIGEENEPAAPRIGS